MGSNQVVVTHSDLCWMQKLNTLRPQNVENVHHHNFFFFFFVNFTKLFDLYPQVICIRHWCHFNWAHSIRQFMYCGRNFFSNFKVCWRSSKPPWIRTFFRVKGQTYHCPIQGRIHRYWRICELVGLYLLGFNIWTYFAPCSSVSLGNFEHVIADWGTTLDRDKD